MKNLLQSMLIALFLGTGAVAYAETSADYSDLEIEEIEAERYEAVDKKWEVEVEYENDKEKKFYVYNIDDEAELISEIADYLNLTDDEVSEVIEIEDDFEDEDKDEDEDEDDSDEKEEKKDKKDKDSFDRDARDAQILALQEQLARLIELVIKLLNAQLAS